LAVDLLDLIGSLPHFIGMHLVQCYVCAVFVLIYHDLSTLKYFCTSRVGWRAVQIRKAQTWKLTTTATTGIGSMAEARKVRYFLGDYAVFKKAKSIDQS